MIVGVGLVVWYYESVNEMCPAQSVWGVAGQRCQVYTLPHSNNTAVAQVTGTL